jgi:putative sterol carrier protein
MEDLENLIRNAIIEFERKISQDEKLLSRLKGITRKVVVDIEDLKEAIGFTFREGKIEDFRRFSSGEAKDADLLVIASVDTIKKLLRKELNPFKAYLTGKLKLKASLTDLLILREFL